MIFFKNRKWVSHLLFWLIFYLFYISQRFFSGIDDSIAVEPFTFATALKAFFQLVCVAATSYFICLCVLPMLLEKRRFVYGLIILLPGLYLISVANRIAVIYLLEPILEYGTKQESLFQIFTQFNILFQYYIMGNFWGSLPFVVFYLVLDRQLIMRRHAESEREKTEAELSALKSQLNPHFLFNTLNNIYSLAVQNSSQTAFCIAKLADILDYLLYRCNDKFVPLEKEIELLRNYFDLQKIRFGNRLVLKASFNTDGSYLIAPLLLLPIVENMFKHGVEQNTGITDVVVSLKAVNNSFTLSTENLYTSTDSNSVGIGLVNLKRQLQLLYPSKHSFEIKKNGQSFLTHLEINLS